MHNAQQKFPTPISNFNEHRSLDSNAAQDSASETLVSQLPMLHSNGQQDIRRSAVHAPEESISSTVMGKSNLPILQMSVTSQNAMKQDLIATGLEEQNLRRESLSTMPTSQSLNRSEQGADRNYQYRVLTEEGYCRFLSNFERHIREEADDPTSA